MSPNRAALNRLRLKAGGAGATVEKRSEDPAGLRKSMLMDGSWLVSSSGAAQ